MGFISFSSSFTVR